MTGTDHTTAETEAEVSDTNGATAIDPEYETLAALYEFCSGVLADPPDAEAVERIVELGVPEPDHAPNERLRRGFNLLESWRQSVETGAPERVANSLERSHTELFVGPRPSLQIHESYYADDYLGEPLARVQGTYAGLDIAPAPDLREEADHAAVELAALGLLTRRESDQPADKRQFIREHGWWFDELASDLDQRGEESEFYSAIGSIAAGLVALDAQRLEVDPVEQTADSE